MYTVSETIENESPCVTYHPKIWIHEGILLWPPRGSVIEKKNIVAPEQDWIPFDCRILRDNIGKIISYPCNSIFSELKQIDQLIIIIKLILSRVF